MLSRLRKKLAPFHLGPEEAVDRFIQLQANNVTLQKSEVISASNGLSPNATQAFSITILPLQAPIIANGPPPATVVIGTAFSFSYQTNASTYPPPAFSIISGSLPPGLTLSTSGILSGTPTQTGAYTATVDAGNGISPDATQNFTISVQKAPQIISSPLPNPTSAAVGVPFSYSFLAIGFPTPTFSITSGSLPPGLALSASGVLSGTPTLGGIYTGTIAASNGVNPAATLNFNFSVQPIPPSFPPTITNGPPPSATFNAAYSFTYATSGYPMPTFSYTGTLPTGITLSSTGVLSGTPTVAGPFTGTVAASNGVGTAATQNFNIAVQQAPSITNGPPPSGMVGTAYNFTYTATGFPTSTFAVTTGSLPTGLTISSLGVISGTPTAAGTFTGTVTASNGVGTAATQNFSIAIAATFTTWASQHFTVQQLSNPAISGPTATPENDGVTNLYKYLFDINPTQVMSATDRAALPAVGMTTNGGTNYLTLTYRENPTTTGLTISVQTSTDLQTWQTVSNPGLTQMGTDPNTGDPIMQVQVPASGSREFIQMNVTSP